MKRLLIASLCLLMLLALVPPAFAHPGDTDENGGHYDRSTGKYHFHHGYHAHQHYDIDGDGIDECPITGKDYPTNFVPKSHLVFGFLIVAAVYVFIRRDDIYFFITGHSR